MTTIKDAETIAGQHLADLGKKMGLPLQLTKIQEEPFGWVFFYQSKEYIETENISSMLAGNAPFIVDRVAGKVQVLGTAHSADFYIKEYARLHS
jgi:hypothetical protein